MNTAESPANRTIGDRNAAVEECRPIAGAAILDAIRAAEVQGSIPAANSRLESMSGYHRPKAIGQTPDMLMPEAVRARHAAPLRGYLENPRVRDIAGAMPVRVRENIAAELRLPITLGPVVTPSGMPTIACIRRTKE